MEELKGILPAIRNMKEFERLLKSDHEYIIFLETRISQVKNLVKTAKSYNKKVLLHVDLIQGLKADEYGVEYLVREIKPDGLISTRGSVIALAKKHRLLAVQRLFILDSQALTHHLKISQNVRPDYIEILPGLIPSIIKEIQEATGVPVIAGGLIRTREDIENAYKGGAQAVTTSKTELWNL